MAGQRGPLPDVGSAALLALWPWACHSEPLDLSIPHLVDGTQIPASSLGEEEVSLQMECMALGLAHARRSQPWALRPGRLPVSESRVCAQHQSPQGQRKQLV